MATINLFDYVGEKIRGFRAAYDGGKGISQEMLAKGIEVSTNTISRWETATYHPTLEDLDKLARFFNISIMSFFPDDQQHTQDRIAPLLRAAKDLPDNDLEELQRYAEYRRARYVISTQSRSRPGRKRKE